MLSGENAPAWKGAVAKPESARRRAYKLHPAQPCEECGAPDGTRHHIDGSTYNNSPKNIAFLCRACHVKRHAREGTGVRGERQHLAKLNDDAVRYIRLMESSYVNQLADQFDVSHGTIRRAMKGRTWRHVKTEAQATQ